MEKLFDEIEFKDNAAPDLNANNLNHLSHAVSQIDDRVVRLGAYEVEAQEAVNKAHSWSNESIEASKKAIAAAEGAEAEVEALSTQAKATCNDAIKRVDETTTAAVGNLTNIAGEAVTTIDEKRSFSLGQIENAKSQALQDIVDAKADIDGKVASAAGYADAAKGYAEEAKKVVGSVYKYKGSVASRADLPSDPATGDVWNIVNEGGVNVAWTGTEWDDLGGSRYDIATAEAVGVVKPDSESIEVAADGTISVSAGYISSVIDAAIDAAIERSY
jgi:hypothetical protein